MKSAESDVTFKDLTQEALATTNFRYNRKPYTNLPDGDK